MSQDEFAAFVTDGKNYSKGSEEIFRTRCVLVSLEEASGTMSDQLVQLRFHPFPVPSAKVFCTFARSSAS